MLIRTVHGALARGEKVGAPCMNFRQMKLAWQWEFSFLARHLAMRAARAWPAGDAILTEWTET